MNTTWPNFFLSIKNIHSSKIRIDNPGVVQKKITYLDTWVDQS